MTGRSPAYSVASLHNPVTVEAVGRASGVDLGAVILDADAGAGLAAATAALAR